MLNFVAAEAWSSDALWSWYAGRRALQDALAALEDAGAALLPLVADSEWHAKGVMALHELIVELRARTASEVGELENRLWEIDALVAS
ncbi:hypothetical protein [Microbacterium abyssi]|uniref:hypothetical protein n=1 Tax=Microbacterium abyssi TaxID=2782166 RepID=UPI001887E2E2|nr:hypothetical protein [Microbacterium sp. A18JL241]